MKITFLKGYKALVKRFTPGNVDPYPMIKKVSSFEYELDVDHAGLQKLLKLYQTHGKQGHCRMKGGLKNALFEESRAGMTEVRQPSHSLILDFDGVKLPRGPFTPPFNDKDIRLIASELVGMLPEMFQGVPCIAHASASLGTKADQVSMHLEYLVDTPIDPQVQKNLMRQMNLWNEYLRDNLRLTATGFALSWPLDICTADNSRLIFIGTPEFDGVTNPIPEDDHRVQLVPGIDDGPAAVSTSALMDWYDDAKMNKARRKRLKELQSAAGLTNLPKEKTKTLTINGMKHSVVVNPPELEMEVHAEYDHYITYNINGGDSHAYYVMKSNPAVVYNWKGEASFLFQRANEDAYAAHIETFGIVGDGPGLPLGFRDIESDTHYAGIFDPSSQKIAGLYPIQRGNMDDFFADHGGATPEPLPQLNYVFDPQSATTIDFHQRIINRWVEPEMMALGADGRDELAYDDLMTTVEADAPTVFKILRSVCGDGQPEIHRFLNWLAYVIQYREKSGTAWLFQGVQGTGKGVLYSRIIKPILEDYCVEKRLPNIEEEFNLWQETSLLVAVDEFRIDSTVKGRALTNKIKNLITEKEITIRAMRSNQRTTRSYTNFITFTNDHDATPLDATDRRFNICPRQETPLIEQYNNIREEIRDKLPEEVKVLSSILHAVNVETQLAETTMNNHAKNMMREASLTTVDEFKRAVQEGRFDFFAELLGRQPSVGNMDETSLVLACQNTLKGWINRMAEGNNHVTATISELRTFYLLMVGKIENENKLRHLLNRGGITILYAKSAANLQCVRMDLQSSQAWSEWQDHHCSNDNVAPAFTHKKENHQHG